MPDGSFLGPDLDHYASGPEPARCDVCDSPLLLRPGRDAVCVACEDRLSGSEELAYDDGGGSDVSHRQSEAQQVKR